MFSNVFTHAFIKDGRLVLVFGADSSAEYRLKNQHKDQYVCAIGTYSVDNNHIFLSSIEGEYHYILKG